jgi:hypothetical protein
MFKTALIAMLAIAASASAAMASENHGSDRRRAGERVRFDRDDDRFDRRDRLGHRDRLDRSWNHHDDDAHGPRRYRPTWVALGTAPLARGGRSAIDVHDRGTFTQLRLQAAGGSAWIDRVIVRFADGSRQVARADRSLGRRDALFEIQLDGNNRRIDQILVVGEADRRGALEVFGI